MFVTFLTNNKMKNSIYNSNNNLLKNPLSQGIGGDLLRGCGIQCKGFHKYVITDIFVLFEDRIYNIAHNNSS